MARYIDAEKINFRKYQTEMNNQHITMIPLLLAETVIRTAPTVEVAEVKRGYWIEYLECVITFSAKKYKTNYKCSICGRQERVKEPYCNCGAKMDGEKK